MHTKLLLNAFINNKVYLFFKGYLLTDVMYKIVIVKLHTNIIKSSNSVLEKLIFNSSLYNFATGSPNFKKSSKNMLLMSVAFTYVVAILHLIKC